MPGARLLDAIGANANILAFVNPDKSIVMVVRNDEKADKKINLKIGKWAISPLLKADSFNTFVVK
jgi:glucosylceramidase